jgi:UDP-N-acetyl-D-glucosamine dehydrogenase
MSIEPLKTNTDKDAVSVDDLCKKFTDKTAVVGVLGLGYVGIPLAHAVCEKGMRVLGFDIDQKKIDQIENNISYIGAVESASIAKHRSNNLLDVTSDEMRLSEADALLMCVPTPLTQYREPDLSYVENTARMIAKTLRPGQLVILESTTYPGTMRDVVKPILEETGLKSGVDFYLAYSPEREDPGNIDFETSTIPKVVGGDGADALRIAKTMYDQFVAETVPVSSPELAEAVKLTENIFRSVNIALVNELKVIYDALGIDVWEVIDAAATKPFGFMPFYPGPGLGGHCIPIDPFYLTYKAREHEISTRFIELAGEINVSMPQYVVNRAAEVYDERTGRGFKGAKILMLGASYKKNVGDIRESPFFGVATLLKKRGALVDYHDPFVPELMHMRHFPGFSSDDKSIDLTAENLSSYDMIFIITDHTDVDYDLVGTHAKLIVDTRNVMSDLPQYLDKTFKA